MHACKHMHMHAHSEDDECPTRPLTVTHRPASGVVQLTLKTAPTAALPVMLPSFQHRALLAMGAAIPATVVLPTRTSGCHRRSGQQSLSRVRSTTLHQAGIEQ